MPSKDDPNQIILLPVNPDNWRDVARITVSASQKEFVAEPCYYLSLCCYGEIWQPLAIYFSGQVIGFMMWGVDPADGSCWFGGIMIDQSLQRRGYGKQAIQAAIALLAHEHGYQHFALSYLPSNPARHLYQALGFIETGEREDDEVVARLSLAEELHKLPE